MSHNAISAADIIQAIRMAVKAEMDHQDTLSSSSKNRAEDAWKVAERSLHELFTSQGEPPAATKTPITAALVQKLRDQTDCSMMSCKNALQQANGDMEQAKELLRLSPYQQASRSYPPSNT